MSERLEGAALHQKKIYDVYIQSRASAALAVAVRLGLFAQLESEGRSAAFLANALSLSLRGAQGIARALSAADILRYGEGRYFLTAEARAYLLPNSPTYLGALIDMENESFLTPEKLLQAARSGKPSVYGEEDVWEHHDDDEEQARAFTAAMHSISIEPALALAGLPIWEGAQHLLDIGAGSGILSIAILQAQKGMRATLFDIPKVCGIAQEYAERYGVSDRVRTHAGDMFNDPYPTGADRILYSQILHDWSYEQGADLVRKSVASLSVGGWLVVHEKLTEPEKGHGPLANALVNLDMLIWTEGQQYSSAELITLMREHGLSSVSTQHTIGYWSVVMGQKL